MRKVSILAAGTVMIVAVQARAQSFDDEIVRLLDTHPQILAERARTEATAAGVDEAIAAFLPSVDLSASEGYGKIDSPGRRSGAGMPYTGDFKKVTLSITQNLFDGFLKDANLVSAKANNQAAGEIFSQVQQATLLQGVRAYLDVLRQSRMLAIARDNEDNLQTQLALEDERVRRGSGLTVDVLAAKSRLQIAKEQRVAFEGALKNAVSLYVRLFAQAPDVAEMTDPPDVAGSLPGSMTEAVRFARKSRSGKLLNRRNRL